MKTRLLGGVLALVLAIVGAVLLSTYVQAADSRAQAGLDPVEVLVIQQPVAAGTTIDQLKSLVKLQSLPKSATVADSVKDLSGFSGKVTAVALVPGEQLLSSRLVNPQSLAIPNQAAVPKGMEEITLKLDPERVVGGVLKAGDIVGVFISYSTGAGPKNEPFPATKLQFHKVLVTRVGTGIGTSSQSNGATQQAQAPSSSNQVLITLAQTGADATKTVHAAEFGKIYLSKENADTATNNGDTLFMDGVLK
ncbi:Flp pilus assembly protein CpaB [Arthrobacter sp. A2-55]|uniref:Flp pilus assembly protein CpaB n=1 Tax=Arthrobacter sp. A2-55 TaxID=2897337 RepID=UPI0021CD9A96|nr:Flp pilus assembly protein CpaB [Arthrobacter sp. A2-55]MCU6481521.1 Flp pilus assembly protein CpaB [Arthrobacter sp. A2-55]